MTRKASDNVQEMDDEVIRCFLDPNTNQEVTTQDERRAIAEQWCAGDYSYHHPIAEFHGLLPIALLIASLMDIDHPLLVSGRGVAYNSIACATILINTMNKGETVAQPVRKHSIHKSPQVHRTVE